MMGRTGDRRLVVGGRIHLGVGGSRVGVEDFVAICSDRS
jgi:hypothetical protein